MAKSSTPKYLLTKNGLAEVIISPYMFDVNIGSEKLNISFVARLLFLEFIFLNGNTDMYSPIMHVANDDATNPITAPVVPYENITTGITVHTMVNKLPEMAYIMIVLDMPYTISIFFTPITGISRIGVMAKYLRFTVRSLLSKIEAIMSAPKNRTDENIIARHMNIMVRRRTMSRPSSIGAFARK